MSLGPRKGLLNICLVATRVNWPPKCCMFSQHFQVTNHWTLLAYVGLREMRILRWYHHRIVGFGLCWLMLAYENCWFFLIFTGGESAHEKYHWGRQETADSRGGSSSVFVSTWEGYGSPGPIMERTAFFRDIIERFMGFVGIVHGMQWEICYIVSLPCFWAISLGTVLQFFVPNFWYDIWVWYQTMLGKTIV